MRCTPCIIAAAPRRDLCMGWGCNASAPWLPKTQTTQLLEILYLVQLVPPFRDEPHAEAIA